MHDPQKDILNFWFEDTKPSQWFQNNPEFDEIIRNRFLPCYQLALQGLYNDWQNNADGALSLIILFDQFPRNMFRGSAQSFDTDKQALLIAKEAIHKGFHLLLPSIKRRFLYLPFEHSESLNDQKRSLELFASMKDEDPIGYEYALRHINIIERFGRFPGRNKALERETTDEEQDYLDNGGGF